MGLETLIYNRRHRAERPVSLYLVGPAFGHWTHSFRKTTKQLKGSVWSVSLTHEDAFWGNAKCSLGFLTLVLERHSWEVILLANILTSKCGSHLGRELTDGLRAHCCVLRISYLNVRISYDTAIPLLRVCPMEKSARAHQNKCKRTSIVVLCTVAPNWKPAKCPSPAEWMSALRHIPTGQG